MFSQFTDDVQGAAAIARRLAAHNPLLLTGAMSLTERERTVLRFQEEGRHRLLVLSLRAGGVGLNLQAASYVFHLDRWWNPAVEDQASDRAHRLGQTMPVNVYSYTLQDSVEQRILDVLSEKRLLFEQVVEGAGIDVGTALGRDELLRVAGLAPGRGQVRRWRRGDALWADVSYHPETPIASNLSPGDVRMPLP